MELGKLPSNLLDRLLSQAPIKDKRVLVGPAVGEDAAVIELNEERVLVAKTDPITFATDEIGWYAVHINANDIAAMGATPLWFLAALLVPNDIREAEVERIFDQIGSACRSLGVTLIGGHTEITYGLERPLIVGAMLGEGKRNEITPTSGARVGDKLILTKGIALEGTAVLAREASARLLASGMRKESIERARAYLYDPGISVVKEAREAQACARVHCMHDPTEGGLATGLLEIARAANVGLKVELNRIPVLPETMEVCRTLGLEPLGLLASGALLISVSSEESPKVRRALKRSAMTAVEIGEVTSPDQGVILITEEGEAEMPVFARDELARYLSSLTPRG